MPRPQREVTLALALSALLVVSIAAPAAALDVGSAASLQTGDDGATEENAPLSFLDEPELVAVTPDANYTVSDLYLPDPVGPNQTIGIEATVTNSGDATANQTVGYHFEGETLWSTTVELDPGDRFELRLQEPETEPDVEYAVANATLPDDLANETYTHGVYTPQETQNASVDARTETALIEGLALDSNTAEPIAGANVTVDAHLADAPGVETIERTTDENGSFAIEYAPAPANYTITVDRSGYQTATLETAEALSDLRPIPVGYRVQEPIELAPLGSVAGTVTDGSGDGVLGANVTLRDADGTDPNRANETATDENGTYATATADQNGSYAFDDVAPGNYTVAANATDYAGNETAVTVEANETESADLELAPLSGTIQGTIADGAGGTPIRNASVAIETASGTTVATTSTDANGTYGVDGLAPGEYEIGVDPAGYEPTNASVRVYPGRASVANLSVTEPANVTIDHLSASDTVEGGESLPVVVSLMNHGGVNATEQLALTVDDVGEVANESIFVTAGQRTNARLAWNTTANQSGTYNITASVGNDDATETVEVHQVLGTLDVVLREPDGTKIGGPTVSVLENGVEIANSTGDFLAEYSFELPPGDEYTVEISSPDYRDRTLTDVGVVAGEETEREVTIQPANGSVSGTVTSDASGAGIGGANVTLATDGETRTTVAGDDGSYAFEDVRPGDYTVSANATRHVTNGTAVSIPPNGTARADLALRRETGTLAGTVVDSRNDTVANATVAIEYDDDDGTDPDVEEIQTGERGAYEFADVPTGNYSLTADAAGYETPRPARLLVRSNETVAWTVSLNLSEGTVSVADLRTVEEAERDETIEVSANVTNLGGRSVERTIWYEFDGRERNATTVVLAVDETQRVSFSHQTTAPPGNYTHGVYSGDDDATGSITILEPADVTIDALTTSVPVDVGDDLDVTATLSNEGDVDVTETVTLTVDGVGEVANETVSVAAGTQRSVTLSWNTSLVQAGEYEVTVATENATEAAVVSVTQPVGTLVATPTASDGSAIDNATIRVLEDGEEIANTTGGAITDYSVDVPAGANYTVEATAPDYGTATRTDVAVSDGDRTVFDLDLEPLPGSIDGSVASDAEIGVVTVTLGGEDGTRTLFTTDEDYSFANVTPGTYSLSVSASGYEDADRTVAIGPNDTVSVHTDLEPSPATIQGVVSSNVTNAGLENVDVRLESATTKRTVTDEDGSYEFDDLAPGEYDLVVDPSDHEPANRTVSVGPGDDVTEDVQLVPFPGIVEGTVREVDTRAPIENATVVLDVPGVDATTTDRDGNFRFDAVPAPGEYALSVNASGYVDSNPIAVDVEPDAATAREVRLDPLPEAATYYVTTDDLPTSITTNETYTVDVGVTNFGELRGNQTVEYRFAGDTVEETRIELGPRQYHAESFEVNLSEGVEPGTYTHGLFTDADARTDELLVVPEDGWTIDGTVTDALDDEPVTNATVSIDDETLEPVQTDENGTYEITGVPLPGEYTLSVSGAEYHVNATSDVSVEFGSTPTVDVAIDRPPQYLGVDSIDAPASVDEGETVELTTNLTNYGTDPLANESVTFLVDGSPVDNDIVTLNGTETTETLAFSYDAGATGSSTLTIQTEQSTLSHELEIEDDSGDDDSGGGGLVIPRSSSPSPSNSGSADVSILSVDASDTSIVPGDTVRVDVTVQNDGDAEGSIDLELTADGDSLDSETLEVPAGSDVGTTLSGSLADPGSYDLAVEGESAGTVKVTEGDGVESANGSSFEEEVVGDGSSDDGTPGFGLAAAIAALFGALYVVGRSESSGR